VAAAEKGPIMKLTLILGLLLFAIPLPAQSGRSDAETKILALENAWNQAQIRHDASALNTLLPETFVYTDYDGTVMTKPQFLADLKDPNYVASMVTNENEHVFTYDNAAVVTGTYHTKGKYKGAPFEHWGRFTDMWVRQNGLWLCVASHTNLIKK
jgi:ketosteroid isomerase-like protein